MCVSIECRLASLPTRGGAGGSEARDVLGASLSALLSLCQTKIRVVAAKLADELFQDACAGGYVDEPCARAGFAFGCVRVGPD